MATNLQIITRVREYLDEATAKQWTDNNIRHWINDTQNEIARVTLYFDKTTTVDCNAAGNPYTIPTDVLEVRHVYYYPDADPTYEIPLQAHHYEQMDSIWGAWQQTTSGDPMAYAVRGSTGLLKMYLYPEPDRDGTLRVHYAGLPTALADGTGGDATTNDVPDGWVDCLVSGVEYRALRKDRDPRWQEAKVIYMEALSQLADHDHLAIAREVTYEPRSGMVVPNWLSSWDVW